MKTLLVIDMVNDFCSDVGALYVGDHVKECIANVKELIAKFRESQDGIIYLCDVHKEDDPEFDLFPPHCIQGTHGECVIDEIEPEDTDMVMDKQTFSGAWDNHELLEILDQEGNEIYICGLCTSICVMETVSDLSKEGLRCKVVEKACCDLDEESHEMAINRMKMLFGAEII
jgi:nicotinamidase-related amidase